jgi:GGDEF domain-containing protein
MTAEQTATPQEVAAAHWRSNGPATLQHPRAQDTPAPVTVSIGYADHGPAQPTLTTVERADHAQYSAKTAGRDRVDRA